MTLNPNANLEQAKQKIRTKLDSIPENPRPEDVAQLNADMNELLGLLGQAADRRTVGGPVVNPNPIANPILCPDTEDTGEIHPVGYSASSSEAANPPAGAFDDKPETRWSVNGKGAWLIIDLGAPKTIRGVGIAWYQGNTRVANFEILAGNNINDVAPQLANQRSTGQSLGLERYDLPADISARYVKLVLNGNDKNDWNSITEVRVFNKKADDVIVPPDPTPTPEPGEKFVDVDGVMLLSAIDEHGPFFTFHGKDPNKDPEFKKDMKKGTDIMKIVEGPVTWWRVTSREGSFASTGKKNYTSRMSAYLKALQNKTPMKGVANVQKSGALLPGGFGNPGEEITIIARPRDVKDNTEAFAIKPLGYVHDENPKEMTLCISCCFPYGQKTGHLFGTEWTHNDYEWYQPKVVSAYPNRMENPLGMKLIKYNRPDGKGVRVEAWIDADPLDMATGKPKNNWKLLWYIDYSKSDMPTWSGVFETFRTDMALAVDIAVFNVRAIRPPVNAITDIKQPQVIAVNGVREKVEKRVFANPEEADDVGFPKSTEHGSMTDFGPQHKPGPDEPPAVTIQRPENLPVEG